MAFVDDRHRKDPPQSRRHNPADRQSDPPDRLSGFKTLFQRKGQIRLKSLKNPNQPNDAGGLRIVSAFSD